MSERGLITFNIDLGTFVLGYLFAPILIGGVVIIDIIRLVFWFAISLLLTIPFLIYNIIIMV